MHYSGLDEVGGQMRNTQPGAASTTRKGLHTPATARIQSRLERLELEHLRALVVEQGEEIERLRHERDCADDAADFWQRSHHSLQEHLDEGTEDARSIGLTVHGELLVVRTGAVQ